jgi:hypothetical protein
VRKELYGVAVDVSCTMESHDPAPSARNTTSLGSELRTRQMTLREGNASRAIGNNRIVPGAFDSAET